jgi:hypothetical protein
MVAPLPIPYTDAQSPRSITLKIIPNLQIDFMTANASQILSSLSGAKKIGAVEKLAVSQELDLHEWREIDADQGGQIVEWAPGKETITLTFTGIVLYSGDVIDSCGYDVDTMLAMAVPFVTDLNQRRPILGGGYQQRDIYFLGCRFKNRPWTADISGDAIIKMDYTVNAARILKTAWQ